MYYAYVCAWFLVRVRYLLQKEREVHRICCAPECSYLGGLHLHNMSQYRGGAACLAVLWNPEIIRVKTATKDYINWGNNWQIQNMWLATLHPTPLHAPPYKTKDIQCHKIVVCCFDQFFKSSSTKNTSSKMLHWIRLLASPPRPGDGCRLSVWQQGQCLGSGPRKAPHNAIKIPQNTFCSISMFLRDALHK